MQKDTEKTDSTIRDMLVVDKLQDIKLICSEKHNKILKLVIDREMSISDIARVLNMNPGSVHYHLKDLERHGLVKQVRQEIMGGIVKKYYRSAAKRILLDSPNFNIADSFTISGRDNIERLIRSIEYLGYQLPPDNLEDAEELLSRFDKRLRELLVEMQNTGLDNVETDGFVLQNAYHLLLNIRAKDDPEMGRIYREFEKLFLRYK